MVNRLGKTVLVTGASGFLGSHLCKKLVSAGYTVRALSRKKMPFFAELGIEWFHCDLPEHIDPAAFAGSTEAVIHCAYTTQFVDKNAAWQTSVIGTQKVREATLRGGTRRFIFISSMAAHSAAQSWYGKTKFLIESQLDPEKDLVIRPGFIIGKGGIFERLFETIKKMPFIPLFYGGQQKIQTIWIEDLCDAIVNAIQIQATGALNIAEPDAISLKEFYSKIAEKSGKRAVFLRLPGPLTLLFLRAFEALGIHLPISSENLLGLKATRTFEVREDVKRLKICPLTTTQALERL